MPKLLTLNDERLEEITDKALDFLTSPNVEADIVELMEAQQKIELVVKMIRAAFKERFMKGEMENSIEGDLIKVSVSQSGSIFKIVDELKVNPSLLEVKLNTEAVADWVKQNNTLPEGVAYNESRSLAVRITTK